jgi:hypothetical protein
MAQHNDQVFQLSLTEIAFTITFILLLLLGYIVYKEQDGRKAAEEAMAKVESIKRATAELNAAKSGLARTLQSIGASNPDEAITLMIAVKEVRAERDFLKKKVDDLDAKLTALTEIQKLLENVVGASNQDVKTDEIIAALALQKQIRKTFEQLDKDLKPGQELQTIQEMVQRIRDQNSDLRGQVAFLKNRLDARGGRDYPPCWVDESGKVEFLFSVNLCPNAVVVTPAWPAKREAEAMSLPGINEILAESHSYQNIPARFQGIFNWSKNHDPQCRHYVQLRSSIFDAVQSDRARMMIENYFYKFEARR